MAKGHDLVASLPRSQVHCYPALHDLLASEIDQPNRTTNHSTHPHLNREFCKLYNVLCCKHLLRHLGFKQ